MIKQGRRQGWLREPIESLPTWASFNGVNFNGITIGPLSGFEERGSTVIADRNLASNNESPVMTVPRELIISRENIDLFAKSDQHLREVLLALDDFGRTTRGAVLVFLLVQTTICCPDISDVGVLNPLTEYVKFLPDELLPTFWTEEEQELLEGTTLRSAVRAKLNSLLREFETVRTATADIQWCAKYWWDEDNGMLTFDDWMRADAMYRSRALEFPGVGDAMVPCVDMANHASGESTVALYETDGNKDAVLLLRDGKTIPKGGEINITYGDEKGACENVFSYGFLDDAMSSAEVLFLDLDIPDDDPLRPAKQYISTAAPGFRLFEKEARVDWESDFIWIVVINEEDGLDFRVKQTVDGKREIQALWKEQELKDTSNLRSLLEADSSWEVFQLRAIVLLLDRVETQIDTIRRVGQPVRRLTMRSGPWELAARLRTLELNLLERAASSLNDQKAALLETESVQRYLGLIQDDDEDEKEQVDFT